MFVAPGETRGCGNVDGTAVREQMFEMDVGIVTDGKAGFFIRARLSNHQLIEYKAIRLFFFYVLVFY